MKQVFILIVGLLLHSGFCQAQDGTLDASFGVNGIARVDDIHANGSFISSAIQQDGKILIGTVYQTYDSDDKVNASGFIVKRFLQNGLIDSSFNPDCRIQLTSGRLTDAVFEMTIQSGGRILISNMHVLYGLNSDGKIDSSFGNSGSVTGIGNPLLLPNDNIILVGGGQTLRLKPNGKVDSTYGLNGTQPYNQQYGLYAVYRPAFTSKNQIIVCLETTSAFALMRLTSKGSLDSSFGTNGYISSASFIEEFSLDKEGNIIVAGIIGSGTKYSSRLIRYFANGKIDSSFGKNGICLVDSVKIPLQNNTSSPINIQDDGRILHAYNYSDSSEIAIRRFMPDGTLDYSFGINGKSIINFGNMDAPGSIILQRDSKIIIAAASGFEPHMYFSTLRSLCLAHFLNSMHLGVLNFPNKQALPYIYPNPIQSTAKLSYELASEENISIYLADMAGKTVQTFIKQEKQTKGAHSEQLNFNQQLPPGNYLLHVRNSQGIESIRVTKQ